MQFLDVLENISTREKFQNQNIAKSNTRKIKYQSSLRSNYDIDARISHISTYSSKNRVSVTYLMTITLINNIKIDIQRIFFS